MASALKSYVEKYLLNPAASFNVDDEGNEETSAQIVENLADDERATADHQSRSKLRARTAALLSETDPRYRGKKVSRSELKKNVQFDREFTKYSAIENGDNDEDGDDIDDDMVDDEESEDEIEDRTAISHANNRSKSLESKIESDDGEEEELEEEEEEEEELEDSNESDEVTNKLQQQLEREGKGFSFDNDGDFSKYADDFEDDSEGDESEDESGAEDEGEEEEDEDDEETESTKKSEKSHGRESIKKFSTNADELEEIQKSQSIKNQLALYDSLFEIRIGMQKGIAGANQLPQSNTFKDFVREKDPNYIKNLSSAKSTAKKLLGTLLEVQDILLKQNPETKHIISGKKNLAGTESNEEITSSEDEVEEEVSHNRRSKRKLKLEEYEEILSKRHAAMIPFRDETINRWYEKTKLLSNSRGRDKFSGFEVSALQQLKNVLNNKPQLIRRTQLTGVTRGTTYHVLGRNDENVAEADKEEYDPEIFDDGDFYSRALEEMLKSKISLSDDMSDVSRKWIEIQKLRKKAKRKVDTKASKGRKLRYEVITKLQQYLAPCCPPQMDDAAINTLFASLFGQGVLVNKSVNM